MESRAAIRRATWLNCRRRISRCAALLWAVLFYPFLRRRSELQCRHRVRSDSPPCDAISPATSTLHFDVLRNFNSSLCIAEHEPDIDIAFRCRRESWAQVGPRCDRMDKTASSFRINGASRAAGLTFQIVPSSVYSTAAAALRITSQATRRRPRTRRSPAAPRCPSSPAAARRPPAGPRRPATRARRTTRLRSPSRSRRGRRRRRRSP